MNTTETEAWMRLAHALGEPLTPRPPLWTRQIRSRRCEWRWVTSWLIGVAFDGSDGLEIGFGRLLFSVSR